jgi:hypothetical protein
MDSLGSLAAHFVVVRRAPSYKKGNDFSIGKRDTAAFGGYRQANAPLAIKEAPPHDKK